MWPTFESTVLSRNRLMSLHSIQKTIFWGIVLVKSQSFENTISWNNQQIKQLPKNGNQSEFVKTAFFSWRILYFLISFKLNKNVFRDSFMTQSEFHLLSVYPPNTWSLHLSMTIVPLYLSHSLWNLSFAYNWFIWFMSDGQTEEKIFLAVVILSNIIANLICSSEFMILDAQNQLKESPN